MPEDQDNDVPPKAKRNKKRIWLLVVFIVLTAIIGYFLWSLRNSKSIDDQLAEIEAAHAIPDSENAAVIYCKLRWDPSAGSTIGIFPEFLDDESISKLLWNPWLSADYPKLAAWLQERQNTIEKLLDASNFEKCRFSIDIDSEQMMQGRIMAMDQWAYMLGLAASNDIAEGRTEDAIAKWRCLVRMGKHLRQQPYHLDYLWAIEIDSIALQQSAAYIVEGDAVEMRLRQIESIPLDTKDNWAAHAEQIRIIQNLAVQKSKEELGLIERIELLLESGFQKQTLKPADLVGLQKSRLRNLASRRGNHILITLRRYKNKHDAWPKNLDEIGPHIIPEALIDPFHNGPFIYRLTDSGFELYSTGKNKIDENAKYGDPFDDWSIWPTPARKNKTSNENANTQLHDPNANQRE